MSDKLKKITNVSLPFDMRATEPSKDYGISGLSVWFILKGPNGAVQYAAHLPYYLPHVASDWLIGVHHNTLKDFIKMPNGIDVGYHSPKPMFEGQQSMKCEHLEAGECYYDGSGLRAEEWTKEIFSTRGKHPEEVLWKKLEREYEEQFGEPQ